MTITSALELKKYYYERLKSAQLWMVGVMFLALMFFGLLAYFSQKPALYGVALFSAIVVAAFHRIYYKKSYQRQSLFKMDFPENWRHILDERSVFYKNLIPSKRDLFEKRVQIFLSEKRVVGIDTEVDDEIRLLIAASGIIPTFAFPAFNYPLLNEVLVYPTSFTKKFEIDGKNKKEQNIEGMVGNQYMKHSLLLSKPALLAGFQGRSGEGNVGIHEFVHLLDREDGDADGIPERLMDNQYALPWLELIKEESDRIRSGKSDINPYAITNNAEFLAVVSEYFFSDPEEFQGRHPELYTFLSGFYGQAPL